MYLDVRHEHEWVFWYHEEGINFYSCKCGVIEMNPTPAIRMQ